MLNVYQNSQPFQWCIDFTQNPTTTFYTTKYTSSNENQLVLWQITMQSIELLKIDTKEQIEDMF